jgi:diguanylate cyclase (GGDEF)-like protein
LRRNAEALTMRQPRGRSTWLLLAVLVLLSAGAASAQAPSENRWLWSDPSVTINGIPATQYRPASHASFAHPVTLTLRIPYDARWAQTPWYVITDLWVTRGTFIVRHRSGVTTSSQFGMLIPVADRAVKRAMPTVEIPQDAAPGTPILLRFTSELDEPRLDLVSLRELASLDRGQQESLTYPLVLICGLLLSLAISNLIYFSAARHPSYVYYFGVMITASLMTLRESPDLLWGWVLPHLSARYTFVEFVTEAAFVICVVVFARSFLDMRAQRSRLNIPLIVSLVAYLISVGLLVTVYTPDWFNYLSNALGVALFACVLAAGIEAHRRGQESARYYVIAFFGVFSTLLIYDILKVFFEIWLWVLPVAGVCWEGFWLTAALADRLRKLNTARENEQLARIAEQEFAAIHDPLTGLFNRRKVESELLTLVAEGRESGLQDALIYVDLDHFKVINDTSGHEAGDQVLVMLAGLLRDVTSAVDTVARIGGDEFAVLLRGRTEQEIAHAAEHIRDAIARTQFSAVNNRFPLSASIGCATLRGAATPNSALGLADAACSQAKDAGRNRVHFVSDELSAASARSEMVWTNKINDALENDRFCLYYQVIAPVNARVSRGGRHIEVLLRMVDEDASIVTPSHFLPAAERYNLMAKIDRWVISNALPIVRKLIERGEVRNVAINLSGASLREDDLAGFILDTLHANAVDPSAICLEITETVVASALGRLTALTNRLRSSGIRFALDDFGTGTSSLALLKRLNVDYLKIDGSFVRDCAENRVDASMVEAIHRLAKVLGIQTIAEYAVSPEVLARLRSIGVDFAQGWAIGRAEPLDSLLKEFQTPA